MWVCRGCCFAVSSAYPTVVPCQKNIEIGRIERVKNYRVLWTLQPLMRLVPISRLAGPFLVESSGLSCQQGVVSRLFLRVETCFNFVRFFPDCWSDLWLLFQVLLEMCRAVPQIAKYPLIGKQICQSEGGVQWWHDAWFHLLATERGLWPQVCLVWSATVSCLNRFLTKVLWFPSVYLSSTVPQWLHACLVTSFKLFQCWFC